MGAWRDARRGVRHRSGPRLIRWRRNHRALALACHQRPCNGRPIKQYVGGAGARRRLERHRGDRAVA
ncbi:hypothetical protein T492DRAFT_1097023 [Pavlovales sp. CCMP2436]|nr:hypothetical protein T492DRAFT_1097023 [Pavlovales sp. CCMP2436]